MYHQNTYSFATTAQAHKAEQSHSQTQSKSHLNNQNYSDENTNTNNNENYNNSTSNEQKKENEKEKENDDSSIESEGEEEDGVNDDDNNDDDDGAEYGHDPAYDHMIHGVFTRRDYDKQTGRASKQIARLGRLYLYQYNVCPFCNKVKTVLDYYNIPYSLIEVSPISKKQLPNSVHFLHDRTVPVLLTAKANEGLHISSHKVLYQSNVIIKNLLQYFVTHTIIEQSEYQRQNSDIVNAWIEWMDNTLIPHIYAFIVAENNKIGNENENDESGDSKARKRSGQSLKDRMLNSEIEDTRDKDEILYSMFDYLHDFKKFRSVGLTSKPIQSLCVMLFKNQASSICYKYGIEKGQEKKALINVLDEWYNVVKITFHGGTKPDLADLNGYAVFNTFENLDIIKDVLKESGLMEWYQTVDQLVGKNCCVTHA